MERFSNYTNENILEHVNKLKNTNTKTCIEKLPRNTLDAMLGQFYAMQAGLDRYFK